MDPTNPRLNDEEFMVLMNKPNSQFTKDDARKLYYHFLAKRDDLINDTAQAIKGYWQPTLDKYWKQYTKDF
jgi:hypothetical protein